jgi:AcrR family transcriptional regulator
VLSRVPRPQLHPSDTMLDAARDLMLEGGSSRATVEAIADVSGAPIGSIYHRFGSRDGLLTRLWIRAVYRSQASFLAALEHENPHAAALAAAQSILEFCEQEPADARLLVSFRREDLIRTAPSGQLADELEELNRPVEAAVVALARRLYGRPTRAALNRTLLAVFDLPYGAVRRYLIAGTKIPAGLRDDLARAVEAVLDHDGERSPGGRR